MADSSMSFQNELVSTHLATLPLPASVQQTHFNRSTDVEIQNDAGLRWPGKITVKADLSTGWKKFAKDNHIGAGDKVRVEITGPGLLTVQKVAAGSSGAAAPHPALPAGFQQAPLNPAAAVSVVAGHPPEHTASVPAAHKDAVLRQDTGRALIGSNVTQMGKQPNVGTIATYLEATNEYTIVWASGEKGTHSWHWVNQNLLRQSSFLGRKVTLDHFSNNRWRSTTFKLDSFNAATGSYTATAKGSAGVQREISSADVARKLFPFWASTFRFGSERMMSGVEQDSCW